MQVQSAQQKTQGLPHNVGLEKGELVPMRKPDSTDIVLKSLSVIGHAMKEGFLLVDRDKNLIPLTTERIHRPYSMKVERVAVFNPGDKYKMCFDPKAPPQDALVYKA